MYILETSSPHSWFKMVETLCTQYGLPSLHEILSCVITKKSFNSLVKKSVTAFWHTKLCDDARKLASLRFLRPDFIPLGLGPHILWKSCRSSSPAVQSAVIQARLLSGRYRCDSLLAKWTGGSGLCSLPGCRDQIGDIVHLLSGHRPGLRETLFSDVANGLKILSSHPVL